MNVRKMLWAALAYAVLTAIALSQTAPVHAPYVPPDIASYGEAAYYRNLAIVESNCETIEEMKALWKEMGQSGALVGVITSPRRMLAWVPPEAYNRVMQLQVPTRSGPVVQSISYSKQELQDYLALRKVAAGTYNEADETIVDYLEYVQRPRTALELSERAFREDEISRMAESMPREEDNMLLLGNDDERSGKSSSGMLFGGPDPQVDYASRAQGYVVHTSFFVESRSGTGSWNWPDIVYNRYKTFYLNGVLFWSSTAAKYGKTLSGHWRLFGRSSSQSQVTGEPTAVGNNVYIPEIIRNITSASPGNSHWDNLSCRYTHMYNGQIEALYSAPFAFCAFISYKPTLPKAIHPTAWSVSYGNGDIEGIFFCSDTQYWQAGLNPLSTPQRNAFAHEMGHLFGAPDEYYSTSESCNYSYRGMKNVNCQRDQPAYGRPGWTMTGLDGIMVTNYLEGTSIATPVHVGLRSASQASEIRCIKTQPSGISYDVIDCDGRTRSFTASRCFPVEADYCMKLRVPTTKNISGSMYYFDHWEVKKESNTTNILTTYGPELPSWELRSSLSDPITDVTAVFTNDPPDFNVQNTTFSAWLGAHGTAVTPARTVQLRWRVKYDMSKVVTKVEWERSSGNWVELQAKHMSIGPQHQDVGKWTGVYVHQVPATGGDQAIQPGTTYRFRIVGYFNTARGTPSAVGTAITRPASPADTAFCYDANEPNFLTSPKVLPSSGPGMDPYMVHASATIMGIGGEFNWYQPKADYYRITAIGLSGGLFGSHVEITLKRKGISNFVPLFRAQRVGSSTYINAYEYTSGVFSFNKAWRITLTTDGEYTLMVEPQIRHLWSMYDLVDKDGGHFGFGEYYMDVRRTFANPMIAVTRPNYVKLIVPRPIEGWLMFDPQPPPELFLPSRGGFDPSKGAQFQMTHIPPPGFENDGWDGEPFSGPNNPIPLSINSQTPPGTHYLQPLLKRVKPDMVELVLIQPDGPGGPLTRRTWHAVGATTSAQANAPAGMVFVGWGYDTSSNANPLPVTMWKHKVLRAYFRPQPCVPEQMVEWTHILKAMNGRQAETNLKYGMQNGAGDGLEPGQTDLPPIPPVGTYDVRWINIPGAQGSVEDLRAVKQEHSYQLRIQISSDTQPVQLSWGAPPNPPAGTFIMTGTGISAPIDMRTTSSVTFPDQGTYMVRITVKAKDCDPPTQDENVTIETRHIDPSNYPCVDIELVVKDKKSGKQLPFYPPFDLKIFEKSQTGEQLPARLTHLYQMDSTIWIRLCGEEGDDRPEREIRIIPDDEDEDKKKDTLDLKIPIPVPEGPGQLTKTMWDIGRQWDMVSLPLEMDPAAAATMFDPWPSTAVFWFNPTVGMYQTIDTMRFGKGYWIKSPSISVGIAGYERNTYTHTGLSGIGQPLGYGWNMIGALSKPLAVSLIDQNPPASMTAIFGWNPSSGYMVPTTLEPKKGYWVRTQPGTTLKMEATTFQGSITFSTAYDRAQRVLEPSAWIEISTDAEEQRFITINANEIDPSMADALRLPPLPEPMVFDVRLGDGTMIAQPGLNPITIQGANEATLKLLHPASGLSCALITESGDLVGTLDAGNDYTTTWLPVYGNNLFLKVSHETIRPEGLALGTAYPNPATSARGATIPYSVASDAFVELRIVDMLGRTIRVLEQASDMKGSRIVHWDGYDAAGAAVPPGLYMCRLTCEGRAVTTTISIIR